MDQGDFSHCSTPRIKQLHKAHSYLCAKSKHYEAWHVHPHHRKVHLSVLSLVLILFGWFSGIIAIQFMHNKTLAAPLTYNINTKEQWEAGTNTNIDTEDLPGSMKIKPAGTWGAMSQKNPPKPIANAGPAYESVGNDIYVMRGGGDVDFWKYTPSTDSWVVLADVPTGVNTGSDLCVGESTNVLYATVGNTTKKFLKYTISTNTWEVRKDLSDTSGTGSSIVSNGTSVFFLRANTSTDFFIYTIGDGSFDAGSWGSGANTGVGNIPTYGGNVGSGADLVWDGVNYLYSLRGAGTQVWFRYTIDSNTWTAMTNYSFTAVNVPTSSIFYNGAIYIFNANSSIATTFLRKCTISGTSCTEGATWTTLINGAAAPNPAPAIANLPGIGRVASDADNLYLFRGYGSYDVWKFNLSGNKFFMPPNFPIAVAAGADIFYNGGDVVYALMGGTNFYYWNKTTDVTWTQCTAVSVVCKNSLLPAMAGDVKTATVGNYIYLINNAATALFRFDMTNPANGWAAVTVGGNAISAFGLGGGLAYVADTNRLYAVRGGNTREFYYLDLSALPNPTWTNAAGNYLPTGMNVNTGGRIVAVGTDVYVLLGNGNSNFYKWNGSSWAKMARAPFNPYYGTDLATTGGKIYALAGYYKSEFYEYSGTTWRRLNNLYSSTPYDLGTYSSASLEFIGNNTLMATRGVLGAFGNSNLSMDVLTYTIDSSNYQTSGTYESQEIDLTYVGGWPSLTVNKSEPNGSTVTIKTKSRNEGESWPESWTDLNGEGKIASSAKRYLKLQATLVPSALNADTPTLTSLSIGYDPDEERPTPPTVATGKSQSSGGVDITSSTTYNYSHPYFEWSNPEEAGGATDSGKSGVAGYYVSFNTASGSDPETSGNYQTGQSYVANETLSNGTYYLRIKAKDRAGNVSQTGTTVFTYIYNGVNGATPITKTLDAELSANATLTNTTVSGDKINLTSKAGFWKEGRLAPTSASVTTGGSIVYKGGKVYMNPGGAITFYMYDPSPAVNSWVAKTSLPVGATIGDGGALVNGPGNYIYAMRGGGSGKFYRYDTNNDAGGWVDADAEDAPDVFTAGGYLIQVGDFIYGIRGSDWAFYRFNPNAGGADGLWESMTNINFGYPDRSASTTVGAGASIAYDGVDTIYAIQGASYQGGFSKYSISGNTWTPMTDTSFTPARDIFLPVAPSNYSHLMWDSTNSNLLFLAGNITGSYSPLYSFSPVTKEWTKLSATPGAVGAGAWWARDGDTIYLTRGGGTAFYKYSISKNYWYTPNFNMFGPQFNSSSYYPVGQGANMVMGDGNNVYAIRGVNDNQFIRYNSSTGTTTKMAKLPSATSNGYTSMVYDSVHGNIYVMLGDTEAYLTKWFVYSIASNTWIEEAISSPATMRQPGAGNSMTFDGTEYIYSAQGSGTEWYRYSTATHTWSAALRINLLPAGNIAAVAAGGEIIYKDNYIYLLRGGNSSPLYRVDVSGAIGNWNWTTVNTWAVTNGADGTLVDGGDGYMYGARAVASVYDWYRCAFPTEAVPSPTWEALANVPGGTAAGGSSAANPAQYKIFNFTGAGTNAWNDGLYTFTEQTANSSFEESGTYISGSMDLTQVYRWANLSVSYTQQYNTTLTISTQTSADGSTWPESWDSVSEEKVNGTAHQFKISSTEKRYIRMKAEFVSGDGVLTPTITDFTVNYFKDTTAPTNPTALTSAKSAAVDGVDITSNNWYSYAQPSFTWPVADAANGATDGAGGSGIAGYYLLFDLTTGGGAPGGDCQGDPRVNAGILTPNENLLFYQTSNIFTLPGALLTNEKAYCLLVTAKDNAGNTQAVPWQTFRYRYDNSGPSAPATLTVSPDGYSSTDSFTFSMPSTSVYTGSEVTRYEYRVDDADPDDPESWHNIPINEDPEEPTTYLLADTLCETVDEVETCDNYEHTFYVRSVDSANNPSVERSRTFYLFRATIQNLAVDDDEKSENDFTFTWDEPAGKPPAVEMNYYYLVNVDPTEGFEGNNKRITATQVSGALAKRAGAKPEIPVEDDPGKNTFYILAGIGNAINIDKAVAVDFWANLPIPDPPTSIQLQDISEKGDDLDLIPEGLAGNYRIVISWTAPEEYNETQQFFRVYATTTPNNPSSYAQAAIASGLATVHINLEEDETYYYYVKTVDELTGIESLPSDNPLLTEVSDMPQETASGQYSTPPSISLSDICKEPKNDCTGRDPNVDVSVGAYTASFSWNLSSGRTADPKVRYGTSREKLDQEGLPESDPEAAKEDGDNLSVNVSNPKVDLYALVPETTYYYRLTFEGGGGGVGVYPPLTSEPLSFTTSKAPKVSSMEVTNISLHGMTVKWESSVPSHGKVTFWKLSDRDNTNPNTRIPIEEKVGDYPLTHTVDLIDADYGTEYRFIVSAIDKEGISFQSDEYSATTLPMPQINNDLKAENMLGVDNPTITVAYTSNVPITTDITYSTGGGAKKSYLNNERVIKHSAEISGLAPKAPYVLEVTGLDTSMNKAVTQTFQITTESDTMPPKIVSMSEKKRVIGDGADAEAQITVKLTSNEPTTMIVEAAEGVGGEAFNIISNEDPLNAEHTVPLKLKQAGKTYSYRVSLKDAAGNPTISEVKTVVIQKANKTAFEYTLSIFARSFGWLSAIFKQ